MSTPYWSWNRIICIICLIISQYYTDGRRYEKCLTPDDLQGVCVLKRYCREATSHPLVACDDDDYFCCPIPTTPVPPYIVTTNNLEPPPIYSESTKATRNHPSAYDRKDRSPSHLDQTSLANRDESYFHSDAPKPPPTSVDRDRPSRPESVSGHQDGVIAHRPKEGEFSERDPPPRTVSNKPSSHIDDGRQDRRVDDRLASDFENQKNDERKYGIVDRESSHKRVRFDETVDEPRGSRNSPNDRRRSRLDDEKIYRPRDSDREHESRIRERPRFEDDTIYRPRDGDSSNSRNAPNDRGRPRDQEDNIHRPRTGDRDNDRIPSNKRFEPPVHNPMNTPKSYDSPDDTLDRTYDKNVQNHPEETQQRPRRPNQEDRFLNNQPSPPRKVRFEDDSGYVARPAMRSDSSMSSSGRRDPIIKNRDDNNDERRPTDRRDDVRSEDTLYFANNRKNVYSSENQPPHPPRDSAPQVPACGVQPYELFIAGGETSQDHEWPWMTAIFKRHQSTRRNTFLCGGSLVNTKYVLTAAHCFVNNYVILPASSFVVRLGSHSLNAGEEYAVSDLLVHHNHSGSDFFNDIALVRLASQVYVTDKIATICLPYPGTVDWNLVGNMATVAGWGDTAFRTAGSRILQHVSVPIVSSDECFAAYSRVRGAAFLARGSDHVICAGLREGGKDACLGDSGGPLMLKDSEGKWVIVGIVSLGYKCAEPGYPGVYTRVTHYMSWIQNNMKRH